MNRIAIPRWSPFTILAVSAMLVRWPAAASAAQAPAAGEARTGEAQTQEQPAEPLGHQMRRYQAFARQSELPPMTATSETTLRVEDAWQGDTSRLAQLTPREKQLLAGRFGVPAAVIVKAVEGASGKTSVGAAEFAQGLRTAVVDYRFLQQEWGRYHPPAEGRQIKAEAVAALEVGDIARAWALYDVLSRPGAPVTAPAPPANLRVVAGK